MLVYIQDDTSSRRCVAMSCRDEQNNIPALSDDVFEEKATEYRLNTCL
jgi:hypothetical protein